MLANLVYPSMSSLVSKVWVTIISALVPYHPVISGFWSISDWWSIRSFLYKLCMKIIFVSLNMRTQFGNFNYQGGRRFSGWGAWCPQWNQGEEMVHIVQLVPHWSFHHIDNDVPIYIGTPLQALTEGFGPLAFGTLMGLFERTPVPGAPYLLACILSLWAFLHCFELPAEPEQVPISSYPYYLLSCFDKQLFVSRYHTSIDYLKETFPYPDYRK